MLSKVPLGNAVNLDGKNFTHFISSPLCSYSSSRHRSSEIEDYVKNLEVEGKVSVFKGLAEASARYQLKDQSSSQREVISLSCSVYARKGFLTPDGETSTHSDRGPKSNFQRIEIGMEDILIVTAVYER